MEGIRVEGANMIVVARVNINLSALTIDQVVSKRRKVVTEMCQSMTEELKSELRGDAWQDLRKAFQNEKLPFGPDGKSEHRGDQVVAYIPEQLEKVRRRGVHALPRALLGHTPMLHACGPCSIPLMAVHAQHLLT